MNRSEKEILRKHEDSAYKSMQRCAKYFGRSSVEFQTARAEWMGYHNMCYLFDVDEVIQDGVK